MRSFAESSGDFAVLGPRFFFRLRFVFYDAQFTIVVCPLFTLRILAGIIRPIHFHRLRYNTVTVPMYPRERLAR